MIDNIKSKVYITQNNKKNYTSSSKYGAPVFITNDEYSFVENCANNSNIITDIARAAESFDPSKDYLLLSGDPVIILLVGSILLGNHGYCNILKWHNQEKVYTAFTLTGAPLEDTQ